MDPGPALTQGFFIEKSRSKALQNEKRGYNPISSANTSVRRFQEAAPDPSFGLSQKSLKKRSLFSAKSIARLFGMLPESYRHFCGIFDEVAAAAEAGFVGDL